MLKRITTYHIQRRFHVCNQIIGCLKVYIVVSLTIFSTYCIVNHSSSATPHLIDIFIYVDVFSVFDSLYHGVNGQEGACSTNSSTITNKQSKL